jgi:hypothetical protein
MFPLTYRGWVPGAHNAWTAWTDKIMKNGRQHGFKTVAMVSVNGEAMWYTRKFLPKHCEIEIFNRIFDGDDNDNRQPIDERLTVEGRTYIIKVWPNEQQQGSRPRHLAAFNGSRYILVCRSNRSYIVVKTEGRHGDEWLRASFDFLDKFCNRLISEGF